MSKKLLKGTNWLLAGILGLLGFTGCETTSGKEEYGSPHADYTVKGKVVDKATQEPIEGVSVTMGYDPEHVMEPVMTDENGMFELTTGDRCPTLYVDDIDGDENGAYESEEIELDIDDAVHTPGSGHWDEGDYTWTKNVELDEAGEPQE